MNNFNYFFTPIGPEYKKKFARNVGLGVLVLLAFYGVWSLATDVQDPVISSEDEGICDPGPLLEDGYCYKNGKKIMFESKNPSQNLNKTITQWDFRKQPAYVIIPLGAVIEGNQHLIPKEITVVLGKNNTITWSNEDDTAHTFVSDKGGAEMWSTGIMKPGELSSVTFNKTGTFEYHGQPGPWITGKVIVLEE